jgi:anhydro-N-acetylmuramic acid kinase
MSGTSADGVDVAITRVTGRGLQMSAQLVRHHHRPYDPALRQAIFAIRNTGRTELRELARIGREVSLTYAAAVTEALTAANLKPSDLAAIAAHGQTLFHDVPLTIQYLDPSLLAYETGIPVVSDFRRADLAAGGQGAPLVPFADYILFRHPTKTRVLLNLGGIANITYLKAGGTPEDVIAFDTGPANCISDHICRTRGEFDQSCDIDGAGARKGQPISGMIRELLDAAYFTRKPPKSTDGPEMIALFEKAIPPGAHDINDLLATACLLTATTIHRAIVSLDGPPVDELIVSGGGIYNKAIMGWLAFSFPPSQIIPTKEFGVPPDAKEALAFALLGAATLDGVPSNVPSVTGARRGVVLGSITPKP